MTLPKEYELLEPSKALEGQVALITGATSGLGWHMARVLACAGAKVAIAGRREVRLNQLAEIISSEGGVVETIVADMTSAESVQSMLEQAEAALGCVSLLVNNAGINDMRLSVDIDLEAVDKMLATNVRGPFLLSNAFAKRLMAEKKAGRIVNISSVAATEYLGDGAVLYSVTKAAISKLTEMQAVEWAKHNININAIAPGVFVSEMTDKTKEAYGEFWLGMRRQCVCPPSFLNTALMFLCDPASEGVTGTVIKIWDGQFPIQ